MADFEPAFLCRVFGHKPKVTIGAYDYKLDYCKRCFMPTSKWLVKASEANIAKLNEVVREVNALKRDHNEVKAEVVAHTQHLRTLPTPGHTPASYDPEEAEFRRQHAPETYDPRTGCTCIQDESRGWRDCPIHGEKATRAQVH